MNQIVDQPSIHLEKCAVIHAKIESRRFVEQGSRSPFRDLVWPPAVHREFRATQLWNLRGESLRKMLKRAPCAVGCGNSGQQRCFVRIAKERELDDAKRRAQFARNVSRRECRTHQQRSGDWALSDGNDGVRPPSAIAGIAVGVERQANTIAITPWLG